MADNLLEDVIDMLTAIHKDIVQAMRLGCDGLCAGYTTIMPMADDMAMACLRKVYRVDVMRVKHVGIFKTTHLFVRWREGMSCYMRVAMKLE